MECLSDEGKTMLCHYIKNPKFLRSVLKFHFNSLWSEEEGKIIFV